VSLRDESNPLAAKLVPVCHVSRITQVNVEKSLLSETSLVVDLSDGQCQFPRSQRSV
jgi:hypothetical protein